ncbi:MAG TPA: AAA family ATPase [Solirubrobacteraceae bacterium]|nr:AAA family ATPase [Solirubrobacteraceae bacterium]
MLRVRLAGSLRIEADGLQIALPRSRRARGLLAYLAAHPGPHSRGHLAARFWPDVLDESARASLRAALTELRQALGPQAGSLVAGRDTVALENVWVDLRDEVPTATLLTDMDDDWVLELRSAHEDRVASSAAEQLVAGIDPPGALAREAERPFVGRAGELARVVAAWDGVRADGSRTLVLLAGEPGIGKTRLALRFARDALADGAAVLLGRCSEDPLAPYEPFADVLRQIGDVPAQALAGAGAAELGRVLGEASDAPADEAGARHRLFSAVDDVLGGIAERRPVVLMLDDLQWADRPTLLLLGFVLRSSRRAPLLAVGTYRDTEIGRRTPLAVGLAELRRDGGAERIGLRGLAPDEVGELAARWVGSEAATRVAQTVHERTGGNAFFVEETLRGLAADEPEVPESVRHAVGARLARLTEPADELLGVAAVIGEVVDVRLLATVARIDDAEPLVDELLDAHLLRLGDDRAVEFTHALVREAVLAELSPLRRARLHRTTADALAARDEERHLEEIAHHLSEAGDERAATYLRRAGERALAMLAYEEAAELFGRALEVADDKDALLLARGDALLRAGEPAAARECFTEAAALARSTADPALLARAALGHAGLGVTIIDFDEAAVARLEEALAALGEREPVLRSQLLARLAVELYYAPTRDRSEAVSAEAVAVAEAAGDARAVADALNARHVALWKPDRLSERRATADAMIEAAHAAGDRQLELQARNWRVVDLFEAGAIAEWREEVRRHGELATQLRMPSFTWYTPLWNAVEALNAGRWDEAAQLRERARTEGTRAGDGNADLFAHMLSAGEALLRGEFAQLDRAMIEDKIAHSPAGMAWRASYAWELAATGRPDESREHLAIVMADDYAALPFDANWPSALAESAEACVLLGDAEPAAGAYARLLPYADVTVTAGRAVITYGSTQRLLAGLAAVLGRPDEAIERHEAAIRFNDAAGFTVWADHSRAALGHIRPRQGGDRRVASGP